MSEISDPRGAVALAIRSKGKGSHPEILADAILAQDGPLVTGGYLILGPDGTPIDVRPLLREVASGWCCTECAVATLTGQGLSRPLIAACIAAAEVSS